MHHKKKRLKHGLKHYLQLFITDLRWLLHLCNLQNTGLQNVPKTSNLSNLKIRSHFNQQNKEKNIQNISRATIRYCRGLILFEENKFRGYAQKFNSLQSSHKSMFGQQNKHPKNHSNYYITNHWLFKMTYYILNNLRNINL